MQRFFYTEDVRQKADEMTALGIVDDISEISSLEESNSFPVIFIGRRKASNNKLCVEYGYFGKSIFDLHFNFEPYYYSSTYGILDFFESLGMFYIRPTQEQVIEARRLSQDMPNWPSKGSIKVEDSKIIVKLSGDECLEE